MTRVLQLGLFFCRIDFCGGICLYGGSVKRKVLLVFGNSHRKEIHMELFVSLIYIFMGVALALMGVTNFLVFRNIKCCDEITLTNITITAFAALATTCAFALSAVTATVTESGNFTAVAVMTFVAAVVAIFSLNAIGGIVTNIADIFGDSVKVRNVIATTIKKIKIYTISSIAFYTLMFAAMSVMYSNV